MNRDYKLRCCILCILFAICSIQASAQMKNAAEDYDIDSTLYSYYLHCKTELASPKIKQITDTLFQMAGEKGDLRMQAVALTTLLDHYYFGNYGKDSVIYYVDMVKEFAKSTNQPKYYYFAWGQRLIVYYIKKSQQNIALFEADKMMKEAEQENYPAGMAICYNIMSNIYLSKGIMNLAVENKEKELSTILKYQINTSNLAQAYYTLGYMYTSLEDMEKAEKNLKKAQEHIYNVEQEFQIALRYSYFYSKKKNYPKVEEYLQKAKKLLDSQKVLAQSAYDYYRYESTFYLSTKQYAKALSVLNFVETNFPTKTSTIDHLSMGADLYENIGNLPKAIQYYKNYIAQQDSINKANENIASGEFAAMLGVEQLNTEKIELQQEVQKRDLANKTRIIFFLVVLLTLCIIIFYREHHLNGKLRQSEKQLSAKNKELLASEAQLLVAKEQAENASIMKTEFIQNMSHEIRTPLNSIVGFSQIISSISAEDEETKEYASIIEKGSNNLLLLVEDVLDLASLDSGTEIPTDDISDITTVCRECIMQVKPYSQPDVEILLEAACEEFYLRTNTRRLFQILFQLLRNAGKFTTQGHILLKWQLDETQKTVAFSVTDTGIGIPPEKQDYIFERFAKIDSFVQGTGLGLPISRLCAEKMGGTLTIDPSYVGGSRFILTLPQKA